MTRTCDRSVDLLVAGSGAAGLTAAIYAADAGLATLVVESTDRWGGTTMRSGGGLWMPNNPVMRRAGIKDSREEALTYLESAIGPSEDVGPASSPERREAFVDAIPEVVEMLERLGVKWCVAKDYPDYYPDRAGGKVGRGIEVKPINARKLGDWQQTSRIKDAIPVPMMTDDVWLLSRAWSTPSGFIRGAQFVFRLLGGLLTGRKLVGMGGGLMLSLGAIVKQQGTEILLDSPLTELVKDDDGRVIGAVVETPDGPVRIEARHGVVLGAGGFARHAEWRTEHHGIDHYTSAAEGALEKGPFTAAKLVLGDLGTKGGLLTDEHARVVDEHGAVIPGLYAAGNTTASVMGRTYPGPGSTIGPAAVFGYLAAQHAAAPAAAESADAARAATA